MNEYQEPKKLAIETDPPVPDFALRAEVIREIKSLGYDDETAAHFARLIGNEPIVDVDGSILVSEGGKIQARLNLTCFSGNGRTIDP